MDIEIKSYTGGMAQTNAYLITRGEHSILIDAPRGVTSWLEEQSIKPQQVLLTHQHYDHVEGVAALQKLGIPIYAYTSYHIDLTLERILWQSGINLDVATYHVDHVLKGDRELALGEIHFAIEHVPGHSSDSLVYVTDDLIFAGDTLFAGGIGRTDLQGGNGELLLDGIRNKILTLPDSYQVFPGHGYATTVGAERLSNPYL